MGFIGEFISRIGENMKSNDGVYWGNLELMKPYDGWHDYIKNMFNNLGFIEIFLIVASALLWTGVYLIVIYRLVKDKSPSMPWVALCLNFSWEFQFAFLVPYPEPVTRWGIYLWVLFDAIMFVLDFRCGKKQFGHILPGYEKFYAPAKIGLFVLFFIGVLSTNAQWPTLPDSPMMAAYLMNLVMSFLFITHMFMKEKVEGLSIWLAWCKFLGTVAPTILGFMWMPGQWFVYWMAIMCALLDATYIVMLTKRFHKLGLNPYTRRPLKGVVVDPETAALALAAAAPKAEAKVEATVK